MKRFLCLVALGLLATGSASAQSLAILQALNPLTSNAEPIYETGHALWTLEQNPLDRAIEPETVFSDSLSNYVHTSDSTHVAFATSGFHTLTFTFNMFTRAAEDSVMYLAIEFQAANTAAGNAPADSALTFHMQGTWSMKNRPSELRGFTGQDTIGHPIQPVATYGVRSAVTGANTVIPSTRHEVIVALRGDPDFAKLGPGNSPKGFAYVLKDWWAPYCRVRIRVLNAAFTGSGVDKPSGMTDPKWRWCQLAITCAKSAL